MSDTPRFTHEEAEFFLAWLLEYTMCVAISQHTAKMYAEEGRAWTRKQEARKSSIAQVNELASHRCEMLRSAMNDHPAFRVMLETVERRVLRNEAEMFGVSVDWYFKDNPHWFVNRQEVVK